MTRFAALRAPMLGALCLSALCLPAWAQTETGHQSAPFDHFTVYSPNPMQGGEFGFEVCQDPITGRTYIGAPGERRIYELVGREVVLFTERPDIPDFGYALSAYDGTLLVGCKASNLALRVTQNGIVQEPLTHPLGVLEFGREVLAEDLDYDGRVECIVSDPVSDLVVIYREGSLLPPQVLLNPQAPTAGSFGHSLGAVHWLGAHPTLKELVVSAPGNFSDGVQLAGKVYVFEELWEGSVPGLVDTLSPPNPVIGDFARFGMNVAAKDGQIGVGAPRTDGAQTDQGATYLFDRLGLVHQFQVPSPNGKDLLGYRVLLGDFGMLSVCLYGFENSGMWFRGYQQVPVQGSSHWPQSASVQQLGGTPLDDIVMGDNNYFNFRGKVVVYLR